MCIDLPYCAVGNRSVEYAADCPLSVPKNLVLNAYGKNRMHLSWPKVKFSDGYQVFMYDNRKRIQQGIFAEA